MHTQLYFTIQNSDKFRYLRTPECIKVDSDCTSPYSHITNLPSAIRISHPNKHLMRFQIRFQVYTSLPVYSSYMS